ncbi:hypothetical protein M408DRAFT_331396 [Serendipita vermifera MAFF 305830]|uniref:Alginate lyase domain-containing protein n=1 Tax=Serendipita vermifera MAFF 305830 TaxID=933852 RepID=A0A0C3AYQ7_SERVB|nr:hypothetical protein M408DRAFT_331396 [Serendipita vermifera MAFF 305830]
MASFVSGAFNHPGVFLDRAQLEFIRLNVNLGLDPWKSAYKDMMNSSLAALDRPATPFVNVECGSNSNPDIGCKAERQDALASYAMSLAWVITRNHTYADKAISYFNAWSYTLQSHNNSNAPLQSGWSGASWTRAAEIIRYTYNGWNATDVTQFENMFRNVYIPILINGSTSNGNWELVMMEAVQGMAVFINDEDVYNRAMSKFLLRVPAYIYLTSDGELPLSTPTNNLTTPAKIIKYWQYQTTFVDGLTQETCRDFAHTGYGLASIGHVAETARIQGNNLYPDNAARGQGPNGTDVQLGKRLRLSLELHSTYDGGAVPAPNWLCNGTIGRGLGPVTEVGYDIFHTRMWYNMPYTKNLTESQRPAGTNYLFLGWETLTHANNWVW